MKIFPFQRFTIFGDSMLPALKAGQDVLCFNWAYLLKGPKKGDIVVIKVNGKDMIKRVQMSSDRGTFVHGDNERMSIDSRKFGPIKKEQIIGRVIWIG